MKIAVVMPVYNEEAVVEGVIREWMDELDKHEINYNLIAVNDGSKDKTKDLINSLIPRYKNKLILLDKENTGHGQSCIYAYKYALSKDYDWIFQIDSDGQCDPAYFKDFINLSQKYKCIYGYRKKREDGFQRFIISRFVSIFAYVATGIWVRDANVPYRLMHRSAFAGILEKVPSDFYLANILISLLQQKAAGIHWTNISFRQRVGGVASVKSFTFVKHGKKLFQQLKELTI